MAIPKSGMIRAYPTKMWEGGRDLFAFSLRMGCLRGAKAVPIEMETRYIKRKAKLFLLKCWKGRH